MNYLFICGIKTRLKKRDRGSTFPYFPHFPRICLWIIFVLLLLAAIHVLLPAVSAEDTDDAVNALMNKGIDCYNKGDLTCTWNSFETAHQIAPNNSEILYYYSYLLSDAKKNNAALEKIDAALALEPESADMWMEKGRILNRLGKYYESDACFDRALEIDPNIPIEATDRFPLNMIIKNFIIIYFIVGFSVLGIYFYFKEIRH